MCRKFIQLIFAAMVFTVFSLNISALGGQKVESLVQENCDICFSMIALSSGKFFIGATDEEYVGQAQYLALKQDETPRHEERVEGFYISKVDVTRRQFSRFAKMTGFHGPGCKVFRGGVWIFDKYASWENPGFPQTDLDPVVCVSWDDANKYISWLNKQDLSIEKKKYAYRLPSEVEWEYAARAGTQTPTYWSGGAVEQCKFEHARNASSIKIFGPNDNRHVNCDDGFVGTSPVGSFQPNPWGLFDMLGDVYQWTSTCSSIGYQNSVSPPSLLAGTDCSEKVIRGASWATVPFGVRAARRSAIPSADRVSTTGFRVVADFLK
ncbi:formylglycine-generating enzyme family protein [Caballeronia mineralivorans]|uniref:formylglycine-generating enzyme family protein n=1 Tax=Caballeronia mineralivorans TaxID=2010198 RepID=UPI00094FD612|nr:SUMF1/EgtB/PvdO family nonheme iron enzyme [Caballeronia mineralivorans]